MKLLTLPNFENVDSYKMYKRLVLGLLITTSGDWLVQIAIVSSLLNSWSSGSAIAIYFLCLFLPKILSPLMWGQLVSSLGLKNLFILSQVLGAVSSLGQIVSLTMESHELFYIATFVKGLASTFASLGYDTLVVERIQDVNEIKAANSVMAMIYYGGITIFPWLGSVSAHYLGNIPTIVFDTLSFVVAAIIFYAINISFFETKQTSKKSTDENSPPLQNTKQILFDTAIVTVFFNQLAYTIFNWYLPIHVLKELSVSKMAYGTLMMLSGAAFVVTSRAISNTNKNFTEKWIFSAIITSTAINGLTLYIGLSSPSYLVTLLFIIAASFASMISIILLKTLIFQKNSGSGSKIASCYNGAQWVATATGFLGCAFFGPRLLASQMLTAMLLLLLTGPLLMLTTNIFKKRALAPESL